MVDSPKVYLAVGPNCWGKGKTQAIAIRNARTYKPSWVKGKVKWIVFYGDPRCFIDDMGNICWPHDAERPEQVAGKSVFAN